MPIVEAQQYSTPPFYFGNAHFQTIIPSMFRKVRGIAYERERIETPDGDFLDLDWQRDGHSDKLLIVSHGLEGSSERHYVKGLIKALQEKGWHGLAWNCRSCSGELNRLPRFYHHGDTADLDLVIRHALSRFPYQVLALAGFSMGGSLTLKYFGERGESVPEVIKRGIAFSVPCDLAGCSAELAKPSKRFYTRRFLKKLGKKIKQKAAQMPDQISAEPLKDIRIFKQFDDIYSSRLHGFADAEDYYRQASSLHYLEGIRRPVLLINTLNDPFLTPSCYPIDLAERHAHLFLEMPEQGGHVGFEQAGSPYTYAEQRAVEWLAAC